MSQWKFYCILEVSLGFCLKQPNQMSFKNVSSPGRRQTGLGKPEMLPQLLQRHDKKVVKQKGDLGENHRLVLRVLPGCDFSSAAGKGRRLR